MAFCDAEAKIGNAGLFRSQGGHGVALGRFARRDDSADECQQNAEDYQYRCRRGREDGVQRYRILVNDGVNYPDYVGDDQKAVMERCLKVVTDAMENSPIPSAV